MQSNGLHQGLKMLKDVIHQSARTVVGLKCGWQNYFKLLPWNGNMMHVEGHQLAGKVISVSMTLCSSSCQCATKI